ncbi:class F sortase [Gryllotalpicola koreensis]|uniref:Class F sortase n=1 Tax=Gryllotalpicola koreensis TaxID=993086 RepID=A0ABP7ZS11_9MICO
MLQLRNRRILWVALVAILVIAAGAAWVVSASLTHSTAPGTTDMSGKQVALDPGTLPSAEVQKQMHAVADTGPRFRVPAVGLDVPVGQISVAGGQLTPPGFTSVYAVRNLGTTATTPGKGTVYVVTHSLRGGGKAPGNYLTDVARQKAAVTKGEAVFVGSTEYTISGTELVKKSDIGAQKALWANTPNRLAVITCLEKPSGAPSTDNLVIYATVAKPSPTATPRG